MIVVCPSCAAHYAIDRDEFGPSARTVRCSACHHEWEAVPDEYGAAEGDPAISASLSDRAEEEAVAGLSDAPSQADVSDDISPDQVVAAAGPTQQLSGDQPADDALEDQIIIPDGGMPPDPGERLAEPDPSPQETLAFSEPEAGPPLMGETATAVHDSQFPPPHAADFGDYDDASVPPGRRLRFLVIAAGSAAALVLFLVVLIAAERPIIRALPGAAAAYSVFGLAPAPPGAGLDIRDVSSSREWSGTEDVLIVAGTVANVATGPRGLPPLRVTLFDTDHAEVQAVLVQPVKATLAEGESVPFVARIANPAIAARRAVVSFQLPPPEPR